MTLSPCKLDILETMLRDDITHNAGVHITPELTSGKQVSLIIPVRNDDAALSQLLRTLDRIDVFEIIIIDSTYRTEPPIYLLQNTHLPLRWFSCEKGRGRQIDFGLKQARGEFIWILHADSLPAPDSVDHIRTLLSHPKTAMGCFSIRFAQNRKQTPSLALNLFAQFARLETRFTTFGDQGFFFRRSDYQDLDIDLRQYPLLEDVALRQAFKTLGHIRKSPLLLITSARRFETYGVWHTQLKNTLLILRYILGENPEKLYGQYYTHAEKKTYKLSFKSPPKALAASLSVLYPRARMQSSKPGRTR